MRAILLTNLTSKITPPLSDIIYIESGFLIMILIFILLIAKIDLRRLEKPKNTKRLPKVKVFIKLKYIGYIESSQTL